MDKSTLLIMIIGVASLVTIFRIRTAKRAIEAKRISKYS